MIKEFAQAVATVSALPAERQAYAASVLRQIAQAGEAVYQLSDDERQKLVEGLADLDNGNVVSDADMALFWARHAE
jgi:ABC-type transporter Mla subunit MlaD